MNRKRIARRRTRLLLILLLGVILRAATLFSVELDRDEIWSMRASRTDLTVELNHAFHLALVAPFTRTLPDVVGIRIVSFWAGLIVIAASARLGFRLGGWNVAVWTALLAALAPYLIAYSQEGRDYMLCAALTTLGLALWLEGRSWLSALCLLGGILAVSSAVLVVLAVDAATLLALLPHRSARWTLPPHFSIPNWLLSHGLLYGATFALNWLVARSPAGAYLPIINNEALGKFLYRYVGVMQCGDGANELLPCLSLGVILWLVLIVTVIMLIRQDRLGYRGALMLSVVLVPLAAVSGLQAINYGIFIHRHLLMTLPALLGLWGIVLLAQRRWVPVLIVLLVAQAGLALAPYYQANPYKPNWRQIVAYVDAHRQPSEPIVTAPTLLDMLAAEAGYHFDETTTSIVPSEGSFWFISLNPDDEPRECLHVVDAGERQVYLFHCRGSNR